MNLMQRIPAGLRAFAARALLPELRVSPEDPRISLSDPRVVELVFGGGGPTKSGVAISEQNALSIATVYACVRVLAETIASLPLTVYQASADGKSRTVASRHPAYVLLHDEPNDFMTAFVWRELAMSHALLWGNHYSQLIWSNGGRLMEIWPLLPWQVKPKLVDGGRRKIYEVRTNDGSEELPDDEILHIPALSLNGLEGISPISKLRETLGVKVATRDFSATFFANGLRPSAILETPGTLKDQAQKNLAESIAEKFGPLGDKFKVMVLEQGAKLHMVQMSPQDAQFIELGMLSQREICGAFRVPPYMVGDLEKANYNNMEQQDLAFAKHVIAPWCVRWEQEINRKLLSSGGGYYSKFSMQALLRGDFKTRTEGLVNLVNNGLMLPNEGRDLEDLDPYADQLNRPRIPLNIGMLDDQGKLMNAPPAKPAPADPAAASRSVSKESDVPINVNTSINLPESLTVAVQRDDLRDVARAARENSERVAAEIRASAAATREVAEAVRAAPAPKVEVKNDVKVDVPEAPRPYVEVRNNVEVQPLDVNVHMPERTSVSTVERKDGQITRITQTEKDA